MSKAEQLKAVRQYCHENIRGVLIELLLPTQISLYAKLEEIVSHHIETSKGSLLNGFDWDVGESRWRNAYLIHLWSEEVDLDSYDDFARCYDTEQIHELITFLESLKQTLKLELADIEGIEILP